MTGGPRDDDASGIEILEIVDLDPPEDEVREGPAARTAPAEPPRPSTVQRREIEDGAARQLLRALLPPLDALESCVRERPDFATLEVGVRMALRGLWDVFRPYNLERIEGDGVPFDPRLHEAAEVTPSDRVPVNTVLETLRVGYLLRGELVRPALVRVSAPATPAKQDDGGDGQ